MNCSDPRTCRCRNTCALTTHSQREREIAAFMDSQANASTHVCTRRVFCPHNPQYAFTKAARTLQRLLHSCLTRAVEVTMLNRPRQLPRCSRTAVSKAAQGMSMADCGKQMGGSPKVSQQHLARETSLLDSLVPSVPVSATIHRLLSSS